MAKTADQELSKKIDYRGKKENANAVKSTDGHGHSFTYKPKGKKDRNARKRVYDRFGVMRDDELRQEAEREWDLGDKMARMWAPERDPEDWRADIILPDGFSAIQSHMQETIDLRPRPELSGVEQSDEEYESYNNHIFQFAMDQTEFDEETTKARNCAAVRGTSFTREEYRYETRVVMDPDSIDEKTGKIQYKKKTITDWDDVYTRHVENENCFFDPDATAPKYGNDCIYREVLDYDIFMAQYGKRAGFENTEEVCPAGAISKGNQFMKMAEDMTAKSVEVLHYENRLTDSYDVCANNVVIRQGPMPNRHKELSLDVWGFYPIPGRIWCMGIPKIIYTLMEERRSIRNMSLDRQKMAISKMFIVNDLFDLDEDDLQPRPHGMIKINTNGLPIRDAVTALEYGDVPSSSLRMDESLKEDERRAHGMDDRPALQSGGTATEAAIVKEGAQRRINMLNTLQNWNTLKRLGKKKWSNVQFHYPAGRIDRIMEDNKWREKTVYRTIKVKGKKFTLYGDPKKGEKTELRTEKIPGTSRIRLDPAYARFMGSTDSYDISVDAASAPIVSKPIKQAQVKEMGMMLLQNPLLARYLDGEKSVKRILTVNDEAPTDWMRGDGMTEDDMKILADQENIIFADMERTGRIYMIPGTPDATEAHTEVHLDFAATPAFQALGAPVRKAFMNHVMQEHDSNPNTGSAAEALGGSDPGSPEPAGGPAQGGGGNAVAEGAPGGPAPAGQPGDAVAGGDVTNGNPVA